MFLYVICALLIVGEVFVPSGGMLGLCAVVSLISGIAIFFRHSPAAGWIGTVVAFFMVPSLLVLAYRLLPRTRFGRRVLLAPPVRERGEAIVDMPELNKLLGRIGRVVTPMRPVGMCEFDGQKVECVAENGYVERDRKIKAVRIEGTQVTVRVIEEP